MTKLTTEELDVLQFGRVLHNRLGGKMSEANIIAAIDKPPTAMKPAYCQFCGKRVGLVPHDATDITCFKCDQPKVRKQRAMNDMTVPTIGETYSQLMEHVRKAQEAAAMLAHLHKANDNHRAALSWLAVSENFKKMQHKLTQLAMGRMN
jgi:hypothetical protein